MIFRSLLPTALLISVAAHHVSAQGTGPERRRRHYDAQARAYYRGPVRFTLGGGIGYYNGDLTSRLGDQFLGPSITGGVQYQLHPHWQLGGEASYIRLGAKDYLPERDFQGNNPRGPILPGSTVRNLAFQGSNLAGIAFVRWEPLHDGGAYASQRKPASIIKPYLKVGGGWLLYNPKAFRGTERPSGNNTPEYLPTERNDYSALAVVLPVGVGVTVRLTPKLGATLEGSYSLTSTDQLDDISPVSGLSSSALNDNYGQLELKLEYSPWSR
ncbi:outer membrane beta-barrel protein [Hymenobacter endophyticus]|uniref:Outer membrane beta-barrel protein n=1 Tax=Hymenobacter endophyticus TaxID=3076335 RepID=A0ABU3TEQ3_9BACT|nr:outer membrane beta-barrel protein [Hymenobacter endophyticus]MDU0369824.1 outer membrane beta-barrel protein [Hymenobacter endophyticus]